MEKRKLRFAAIFAVLVLVVAACGNGEAETTTTADGATDETYTIGVSNTLVGNAWREQMVCAIQAEARSSGVIDRVVLQNENTDTTGQIAQIEALISQGVDAIILNPTSLDGLNSVLEEAISQGIVVVAIDQAVTANGAYVATNDQELYGELGARWLFEELGGEGNVVEMRGIDGVPADTDRHTGFMRALEDYPGINIVQQTFTGWDPAQGAAQALEIISAGDVDGIWTSGIDYTVVEQFQNANADFVPVVGADNNEFVRQLLEEEGVTGVAVTNPPAIGGVGAAVAIQALTGQNPPSTVTLEPETFDHIQTSDLERLFNPDEHAGWSTYVEIAPWTTYRAEMVSECESVG